MIVDCLGDVWRSNLYLLQDVSIEVEPSYVF